MIEKILIFLAFVVGTACAGVVLAWLLWWVYTLLRSFYIALVMILKDPAGTILASEAQKEDRVERLVESVADDEVSRTLAWFAVPLDFVIGRVSLWKFLLTHKEVRRRLRRMRQRKHEREKEQGA